MGKGSKYIGNKTALQRDYIIRYYPNSKDTHTNYLIGYERCRELIGDIFAFARLMERVQDNQADRLVVKRRSGIRFDFARR